MLAMLLALVTPGKSLCFLRLPEKAQSATGHWLKVEAERMQTSYRHKAHQIRRDEGRLSNHPARIEQTLVAIQGSELF